MARVWKHIPKFGRQVERITPIRERRFLRLGLVREGCTNRPFFTIHVKYNTNECKDPGLEQIGSWDPFPNQHGEQLVGINLDRLSYWLARGAVPTDNVAQLLGLGGALPVHPRSYLLSHRYRVKGSLGPPTAEKVGEEEVTKEEESGEGEEKKRAWGLHLR